MRLRILVPGTLLVAVTGLAFLGPTLIQRSPSEQDLLNTFASPGRGNLLGTDSLGRDQWVRLVYGLRISLGVAIFSQVVQLLIGVPLGIAAGYFGGRIDKVVVFVIDTVLALPVLVFALVISANVRANVSDGTGWWASIVRVIDDATSGLATVLIVLVVVFWAWTARVVRSVVLSIRERDYIRAARSMGSSHWRIMHHHILPHVWGPVIVATTLAIPLAILAEAGLSFLQLGVQPPTPSLGLMIAEGILAINSFPLQVIIPATVLALITLAFQYFGDGLRLHLDPDGVVRE